MKTLLHDLLIVPVSSLLADGGTLMLPLVIFAVILWGALGARALLLLWGVTGPDGQVRAIPDAVQHALSAHEGPVRRTDVDAILAPYFSHLKRYALLIRSLVVVAPLGGLLGTVGGMIETFRSLEQMALFTQGGGVAGGIAQALLTTQMGLAVAIPGIIVGRLLERRARKLRARINSLGDAKIQRIAA